MGWTWGRYNAPSDRDYDAQFERFDAAGLQRTCTGCGDPVMVSRGEEYQLQVFCRSCQQRMQERKETKTGVA